MATKSKRKSSRAKQRARAQHAVQEQTPRSLPESAGWGLFLVLAPPMSVVGWFVMRPYYSADAAFVQRFAVALVLGTVLSALLTYVGNGVLHRIARKRRTRR